MLTRIATLLAMVGSATLAHAQQWPDASSTRALADACEAVGRPDLHNICTGYILGVGSAMEINGAAARFATSHDSSAFVYLVRNSLCSPRSAPLPSAGEMRQAVMTWVEQHPEQWQLPPINSVSKALASTWPCPGR